MKRAILCMFAFCAIQIVYGKTRLVPLQYPTIQAALDSCKQGDSVLVSPGIYYEHITWPRILKIKLVGSPDNPAATVIDGGRNGRVVSISGIGPGDIDARIFGFTIQNGSISKSENHNGYFFAAGIRINSAKASFSQCIITKNRVFSDSARNGQGALGGAVYNLSSTVTFSECKFTQNKISNLGFGGGAAIYNATTTLVVNNSSFEDNSIITNVDARGVISTDLDDVTLNNVTIQNNSIEVLKEQKGLGSGAQGGAIYTFDGILRMNNCLVTDNILKTVSIKDTAVGGAIYYIGGANSLALNNCTFTNNHRKDWGVIIGAGIYYQAGSGAFLPGIANCIFWNYGNGNSTGSTEIGIPNFGQGNQPNIQFTDVYGGFLGNGNINLTPKFMGGKDYHLQPNSPCINAGHTFKKMTPDFDLDGNPRPVPEGLNNVDLGCYEVQSGLQKNTPLYAKVQDAPGINIFPNPSHDKATLKVNYEMIGGEIQISGLSGSLVRAQRITGANTNLDIAGFLPGTYFYRIIKDSKELTNGKIVIQ